MDAHRALLDAAIAAVTGLTTTGTRVFEDPTHPIALGELPALAVEPEDETSERITNVHDVSDADRERHSLGLLVHCLGTTPAERDTMTAEVKTAVLVTSPFGYDRTYTRMSFQRSNEGEQDLYSATVRFDVEYDVMDDAPTVAITT